MFPSPEYPVPRRGRPNPGPSGGQGRPRWWALVGATALAAAACSSTPDSTLAREETTVSTASTTSSLNQPTTSSVPAKATTSTTKAAPITSFRFADQVVMDGDFAGLDGRRVGLIVNQTAVVNGGHLVDAMAASDRFDLVAVFGPEHGFRGTGDAGQSTADATDATTGLPVFSLYGATRKATPEMLAGIDVLVYDITDVGVRFYTFVSTMGLAMQAAADAGIDFVVLDRPNPNPSPVSGFVRTPDQESFISQYPIPAQYGLTAGELALAIRGEGWLPGLADLNLTVVTMDGWSRGDGWPDIDWIAPSPGLPTLETARTYPGIVLFEATTMSLGRGTDAPFSQVGAPWFDPNLAVENLATYQDHPVLAGMGAEVTTFTPRRLDYMTGDPLYVDQTLPAVRVYAGNDSVSVGVALLVEANRQAVEAGVTLIDRPETFDLLAGSRQLRTMLEAGASADEIITAWADEAAAFATLVEPYRIYSD